MVTAITDKKGIVHLYLHNPGLKPVEIWHKMVVGTTNEPGTFHINMRNSNASVWITLPQRSKATSNTSQADHNQGCSDKLGDTQVAYPV
jgi:hypothetical protein